MFEKLIRKRICVQIQHELQGRFSSVPQTPKYKEIYQRFRKPYSEWKDQEYEELAAIMDVSASSLRRLVGCKGYQNHQCFSARNQNKIARFLHYNNWQALEQDVLLNLIKEASDLWEMR